MASLSGRRLVCLKNSEKRKRERAGAGAGAEFFGLTASVLAGERRSEAATRKRGPPLESGT